MGNNGNCDVCPGNQRSQMDIRRQKAMMYENRYASNQMMPRMQQHGDCGNSMHDELRGMPIAMGYVPWQNFGCTYEPMEGLHAGTIFPELEKPFYGRKGMR